MKVSLLLLDIRAADNFGLSYFYSYDVHHLIKFILPDSLSGVRRTMDIVYVYF